MDCSVWAVPCFLLAINSLTAFLWYYTLGMALLVCMLGQPMEGAADVSTGMEFGLAGHQTALKADLVARLSSLASF